VLNDNTKQLKPTNPGIPHPGLCNSKSIPRKPKVVNKFNQASKVLKQIGLPAIIRPAFTLGGLGGGIAKTKKDFYKIIKNGLHESPVSQVLVEECLEGWKEFEMEVVRDKKDNCIIICSIENIDPM